MKYCPFCGECREIKVITSTHPYGMIARVQCGHCDARGPSYVEEDRRDAQEAAINAWNEAYRPNPLLQRIKVFYRTTLHRLGL